MKPRPGDFEFYCIIDELAALHERKAADYGSGTDPLANIRTAADFGIPPWLGAVLRANDKMQRLKAFAVNGKLANESVEDSLLDLASYAIIALVLRREQSRTAARPDDNDCKSTI